MPTHNRNIVRLQWAVIAVLFLGGAVAFAMLMNKTDQYRTQRDAQNGNISSLKEQVRQAKLTPAPTVEALPEAVSNGPAAATPTPTPTPTVRKLR